MKRKIAVMCVLALSATAVLGGCGGGDKKESASGKTTIRFASWDVGEDADRQQAIVDKFNESQDEIEVAFEAYGSDFDTKISAGMGSGDAPDVMYMWNYPAYHEGLEPIGAYLEKEGEEFKAKYEEALWNYNAYGDEIYGVPVGFTTHVLYFNKDIFAEAGVEEPTADWTWDDLIAAAKTISEKTDAKGFSFQMKPDPYDFEMYLWSNGTAYCDKEQNMEGNLNSDEAKEVFQMFQDMEKEGYAIATEKDGSDEFRAGQTAMYINASWAISNLDADGVNYGVTKQPAFEGKTPVSIVNSSGIAISAKSEHKDAAWEFMKFYSDEEYAKAYKEMNTEGHEAFVEMLAQSGGHSPASFIMEDWSEASEALSLAFEEIFNPSSLRDVAEALDEAAQQ